MYIENDSHLKMPHQITMWKLRGYRCSADAQEKKKKKHEEDQRERDREKKKKSKLILTILVLKCLLYECFKL